MRPTGSDLDAYAWSACDDLRPPWQTAHVCPCGALADVFTMGRWVCRAHRPPVMTAPTTPLPVAHRDLGDEDDGWIRHQDRLADEIAASIERESARWRAWGGR